ncbi:MAG: hypothetical protein ACYC3G_03100 [Minisyncoccota bacterium]
MEENFQLQVKPFNKKEGVKYRLIQITDVQLHTNAMRVTVSAGDKIKKAFELNKPIRVYGDIKKIETGNDKDKYRYIVELLRGDPNFVNYLREEEKNGYKVVLSIPQNGIPVLLGKDAVEFSESKKGNRFLRWFGKK